jgi:lysine-N-methylase
MARKTAPIHLPVFQRYDCHSCGHCCRILVVNVTAEERRKIIAAGWLTRLPGKRLFVRYRYAGRRRYRLAQQADGRCIFLNDNERCRLHAETGAETKPLPCRMYPFVPTPGVDGVRLDLRADCPSVAGNRGRALNAHEAAIRKLADEAGTGPMAAPPAWRGRRALSVAEFEAVTAAFTRCLREASLPLRGRLRACCQLLELLAAVQPAKVRDERFIELMDVLASAAVDEARSEPGAVDVPPRTARLFRQWLFLHALSDLPGELQTGRIRRLLRSWSRYGQSRRFADGTGPVPRLASNWPATTFEEVAAVQPGPEEALEPLCRMMLLKLDAQSFAGPGYFGYDLISGLTALCLLPSVVGWFARLAAVTGGRREWSAEDLLTGVRRAADTYGVSPVFARISERLRLRGLSRDSAAGRLLTTHMP